MAKQKKLKICLATAELTPLAKSGGLADVSAALSAYLHGEGHDVRVLMPFHSQIDQASLNVEQLPNLQNLSVSIGPWNLDYSIDRVTLPANGLPVYLLRCPSLYDRDTLYTSAADEHLRFVALSRVAIEMCQHMGFSPDVFHCNDWHTGLIPLYIRSIYSWDRLFANTRSIMTIHNIGYQGVFGSDILDDLDLGESTHLLHQQDLEAGRINFLKTGLLFANVLSTVSPTYAREIQGGEFGMGLDELLRERSDALIGILNGVDYDEWNPATDTLIPAKYSADDLTGKAICKRELMQETGLQGDEGQPVIGIVSRLVGQKGIDLMERVLPGMLARRNFSLAVLGSGERRFEQFFASLQSAAPDRVSFYRGYSEKLAHCIEAGSDMFLMPSVYEPCGLNQMYSLKYGTVPIVRETGGLADSVEQIVQASASGTGILFRDYDEAGLEWAINRGLDLFADKALWREVMLNGMAKDFSWQQQGALYVDLYRRLSGS
jgi:starch synthase